MKDLFCECGRSDCRARLSLGVEDYDRVRAGARRFFVLTDHNIPGAETLVEEHGGWAVVEKSVEVKPLLDGMDERNR